MGFVDVTCHIPNMIHPNVPTLSLGIFLTINYATKFTPAIFETISADKTYKEIDANQVHLASKVD